MRKSRDTTEPVVIYSYTNNNGVSIAIMDKIKGRFRYADLIHEPKSADLLIFICDMSQIGHAEEEEFL